LTERIHKISVLYVEDCEDLSYVVSEVLRETGEIDVEIAHNPVEALDIIEKKIFDVIISDYQMPEMSGIEFLKTLNKDPSRKIPFIVFTGKSREEVVIEAINNGASFYIQKGGDTDSQFAELIHKIKHAAAKKRLEDSLDRAIKILQLLNDATLHDVKNLLTGLFGSVELIGMTEDAKLRKDLCDRADNIINSCRILINEASNYHQVGINRHAWYLFVDIISKQEEKHPDIVFVNDIPRDLEVFVDRTILDNVFSNLVDNSKRHGQKVSKVFFSITDDGKTFKLVYEDNGVGIDPSIKEKIFTRGFGKNTGLGLFLVNKLLEIIDMTIVENGQFGKGVRFEIAMPPWKYRLKKQ